MRLPGRLLPDKDKEPQPRLERKESLRRGGSPHSWNVEKLKWNDGRERFNMVRGKVIRRKEEDVGEDSENKDSEEGDQEKDEKRGDKIAGRQEVAQSDSETEVVIQDTAHSDSDMEAVTQDTAHSDRNNLLDMENTPQKEEEEDNDYTKGDIEAEAMDAGDGYTMSASQDILDYRRGGNMANEDKHRISETEKMTHQDDAVVKTEDNHSIEEVTIDTAGDITNTEDDLMGRDRGMVYRVAESSQDLAFGDDNLRGAPQYITYRGSNTTTASPQERGRRVASQATAYRESGRRVASQAKAYRDSERRVASQATAYRDNGRKVATQSSAFREGGSNGKLEDLVHSNSNKLEVTHGVKADGRTRGSRQQEGESRSWGGERRSEDSRDRLRRILAPLPRHSRGPVPTLITPEEEEEEEEEPIEEFVCPAHMERNRLWKAYPDPTSCRHYYICLAPAEGSAAPATPVRHGCTRDLVFRPTTETCALGAQCSKDSKALPLSTRPSQGQGRVIERLGIVGNSRGKQSVARIGGNQQAEERKGGKQGLFVEFVEFLIKSRLFNEKVVKSLMENKELFL